MSEHRLGARAHARAFALKGYLSSGVAIGALAAALAWPGSSQAACNTAGTTVTCSGTTTGANGFGTGTEDGLTINVQTGATVTGTGASPDGNGIFVNNNDTVNNSGAVTGTVVGINAKTGLNVTNNSGATITGTSAAGISAADVTLSNAGTITGGGSGVASTVGIWQRRRERHQLWRHHCGHRPFGGCRQL